MDHEYEYTGGLWIMVYSSTQVFLTQPGDQSVRMCVRNRDRGGPQAIEADAPIGSASACRVKHRTFFSIPALNSLRDRAISARLQPFFALRCVPTFKSLRRRQQSERSRAMGRNANGKRKASTAQQQKLVALPLIRDALGVGEERRRSFDCARGDGGTR